MAFRDFAEDLGECKLHDRSGVEEDHAMLAQVVENLIEISTMIVDNGPAAAPSRHTVDLAESASADYWGRAV